MAIVSQVMTASLKNIIVAASESDINPDDANDFIFNMNMWFNDLAARGIDLGYTSVDDVADEVTIPDGALLGTVKNLAVLSAPDYGYPIPPQLQREANFTLKTVEHLGITVSETHYPGTLPIGSGNEGEGSFRNDHFFESSQSEILTEASGPIGLESSTEDDVA